MMNEMWAAAAPGSDNTYDIYIGAYEALLANFGLSAEGAGPADAQG